MSRVGGAAQIKAMKKVAGTLRLGLAQFRELEAFTQFGSDLDEATKHQLERGKRLEELLKQKQFEPLPVEYQVVQIYAVTKGLTDDVAVARIQEFSTGLIEYVEQHAPELCTKIRTDKAFDDAWETKLQQMIKDFKATM